MIKLVKRGDTYRPEKVKASILRAGASEEIADKIVASVKVHDGLSTLDIRKQVITKLRELDPSLAGRYESYKKGGMYRERRGGKPIPYAGQPL